MCHARNRSLPSLRGTRHVQIDTQGQEKAALRWRYNLCFNSDDLHYNSIACSATNPLRPRDKLLQRHRCPDRPCRACARSRFGRGFLVAQNQDERHLLQAEVANLRVHLLVARIEFHAQPGGLKLLPSPAPRSPDASRSRSAPAPPAPAQATSGTRRRSAQSARRRNAPPSRTARDAPSPGWCSSPSSPLYSSSKRCRQVEVELHRRELPHASQHVDQLDVDLRPVERRLAGDRRGRESPSRPARSSANRSPCPSAPPSRCSPSASFGSQVESSTLNSAKPKVCSTLSANSMQATTSSSICPGVQKMCASSCVKPRTRSSPCMVPERS